MNREEAQQVLQCAMSVGEQMLINGAEVSRVEDSIRRICTAYGAERVDVFSITSSIVTTMFGPDFGSCTHTRRVSAMHNDFHKLDELNQLSRKICAEKPAPDTVPAQIEQILNGKRYSFWVQLLVYALVSGSFSVFFGGDLMDMVASSLIGVILKCLESFIRHSAVNSLFTALLCSAAGGFLANLSVRIGLGHHVDLISIGNIMLFISGVAFTNSLRDLFSGDTITGLIRFIEAILLAVIVAFGFTLANFIF